MEGHAVRVTVRLQYRGPICSGAHQRQCAHPSRQRHPATPSNAVRSCWAFVLRQQKSGRSGVASLQRLEGKL
jgi:hypothetical protein